jgi:phosphoribosylaminoimidazole carboxylase
MIDCTIGMIGGGQLGRMSVEAANSLNIKVLILDKQPNPAGQVTSIPGHIDAEYKLSPDGILALAAACDVITMEIEHINCEALDQAKVAFPKLEIHPSADTIRLIQDKYAQKVDLLARGIPVAPFCVVANTIEAIEAVGIEYGYPFLLKARRLAYDGRGNYVVKSKGDIPTGYAALVSFLSNRSIREAENLTYMQRSLCHLSESLR